MAYARRTTINLDREKILENYYESELNDGNILS